MPTALKFRVSNYISVLRISLSVIACEPQGMDCLGMLKNGVCQRYTTGRADP